MIHDMNIFKIAALTAIMGIVMPAYGQSTSKFTATKANEYGLVYTLPQSRISVTVAVEKKVSTPGEFYKYAKRYLNANPIQAKSVDWKIIDVVINPSSISDAGQRYLVTLKGGLNSFIMVNGQNCPIAINDEEYVPVSNLLELPQVIAAEPTILELPVAKQAVTEEMIQSRSSAKRAELAAEKIYELRRSRNEIISGQAESMPTDGEAMKVALAQTDAQEAALTAMFLGTTSTSVEVMTVEVDPQSVLEGGEAVIARLSAVDGLVAADDLSGAPITMSAKVLSRGELPVNEKGIEKAFPKGGIAYCIPGSADIRVSYEGEVLARRQLELTQLGIVFGLDPALFTSKKEPAYLHFDPLTGAVKELGTIQ